MGASPRSAVRRTGQVLTGLGALVVLCAVLAGGPIALLAFAGNPLPDHLPTLAEVGTALTSRDDGQLFLRALAVVGWFGWATFAFSVLVELLAAALRRPAPRLPGMRRQQRVAAALVGSVALILAASPAAASAATLAAPHPVAAAPAVVGPQAMVAAQGVGAPPARTASVTTDPAVYRVAKGDYLGEVAERYLDDFDGYREVARLNRLADPDRIRPGQLIKLPERAVDAGARRHATGRLVVTPAGQSRPAPGSAATPGGGASSTTPKGRPSPRPSARDTTPTVEAPTGPAMSAGASRATPEDGINRPLAISAVLAVASIVGAQIGAVLGLRRRPATRTTVRDLVVGRHRRG
ncbi:LysM peptidoglycan-binding domain-containing protein [Micromonospora terminaliae]|uniref:LysM peptidoglycan-binding domain-containing protein n=1 Tax=Micromonospora terminaliae TaxID=1914461 RepID=A0AAJ2ZAJ5_9ACTN|nr:LysM domain-containing protein [Micromonospora terminaliae]NES26115.1 LysM peptidoglycan-binding domain-containing protein [Micromonospora terminaliae]QGL50315.1 LysM peptidoglycan-binding domain-containing protein [Micromonospora terminaliae]